MATKAQEKIFEALAAPFYANEVEWKIQTKSKDKKKAMVVPFIQARSIMQRLDAVVGPDNWQDIYSEVNIGGINCTIMIRVNDEWISKNDGAETIVMTTYDDGNKRQEMSLKGTYSAAFKRTAVKWGIGRYLYDIPRIWVPLREGKYFDPPVFAPEFLPEDADPKTGNAPGYVAPEKPRAQQGSNGRKPNKPEKKKVKANDTEIAHAKQHNIPAGIGVPMEGKTLGEAMKDASMGPGIIVYLAGKAPNKSKQYFDPEGYDDIPSENLQKLQRAALILYDNVLNT